VGHVLWAEGFLAVWLALTKPANGESGCLHTQELKFNDYWANLSQTVIVEAL
jgi:hypothetical protein